MDRITVRGKGRNVYLTGYADVCWGGRLVGERAFCTGCHGAKDNRDVDRSKCGPLTIIDRLAAYEDTGLEPEDIDTLRKREQVLAELLVQVSCGCAVSYTRLTELAQAEKDGRLVVLPCKVGDTVYRVLTTRDTDPIVTEIEIKTLAQAIELIGKIGEHKVLSWYLTREEAEAALKKREADNETD